MDSIASRVASGVYQGIADDSLKDEDNGIWLMDVPLAFHEPWFQRFRWIRWLDRLAEQEQVVQGRGELFQRFRWQWARLRQTGAWDLADVGGEILGEIQAAWFQDGHNHALEISAWDEYVTAIATYHHRHLCLDTLADFETMLDRLAGSCFQFLPHLTPQQRRQARALGMVDQGYNVLRDMAEDARQGLCYFPTEILDRFQVHRSQVLAGTCGQDPAYRAMMEFWVLEYLPQLRRRSRPFLTTTLPPDWQALVAWFHHRYQRIERVMVAQNFDFQAFAPLYWQQVSQELTHLAHRRPLRIVADLEAWGRPR